MRRKTWSVSFQEWSAVQWKHHRCRRADRAPGRGRAGACPSSRLGRTGRFCSLLLVLLQLLRFLGGVPLALQLLGPGGGLVLLTRGLIELDKRRHDLFLLPWRHLRSLLDLLPAGEQQRLGLLVTALRQQTSAEPALGLAALVLLRRIALPVELLGLAEQRFRFSGAVGLHQEAPQHQ